MAIPVSPPVALPPGDRAGRLREVAMSLHHQAGHPGGGVDRDGHPGATGLVAMAREWAARA